MCGIGGFVDYEHDTRGYGPVAERMKRTLAPRGPDAEGQFCDLDAMLVHRRLIVIDPDGGQQPMASSDGNTVPVSYTHLDVYKRQADAGGRGRDPQGPARPV